MIDLASFQVNSLAALALSALPTISPLSFQGELIWISKSEWFRVYGYYTTNRSGEVLGNGIRSQGAEDRSFAGVFLDHIAYPKGRAPKKTWISMENMVAANSYSKKIVFGSDEYIGIQMKRKAKNTI